VTGFCGKYNPAIGSQTGKSEALLEAARSHEMTPEECHEQRISFVYGNLADDPTVSKDHAREADRRMRDGR
jgi:hypothetical protein